MRDKVMYVGMLVGLFCGFFLFLTVPEISNGLWGQSTLPKEEFVESAEKSVRPTGEDGVIEQLNFAKLSKTNIANPRLESPRVIDTGLQQAHATLTTQIESVQDTLAELQETSPVDIIEQMETAKVTLDKLSAMETTSISYNGVREGDTLYSTIQSHFCTCKVCCGQNGGDSSVTASGMKLWLGMANPYVVACNWLPFGSILEIGGQQYTVQDRGGHSRLSQIGGIDVFVPEGHNRCYELGLIRDEPIKIVYINKN